MEYSAITKIKKRDGRIVNFDKKKIVEAIFKAAKSVGGKDIASAEELAGRVVAVVDYQHDGKSTPTVEEIQDIVERVLIKAGHVKTAKAYILYRQQQ
ncbi:MAG: ribonucleoside triphosphate reductase, partial [Candidatus Aenigmarchaeota archaeon]|nr:ribonucleoside triphosphate reductase [Candidatus Aenigmarchaeota archaeon]